MVNLKYRGGKKNMKKTIKKRYVLRAEIKDEITGLLMVATPIIALFVYLFITR